MTTLLVAGEPALFECEAGQPTLDEVIGGVWEGLTSHRSVSCPVCHGPMEPEYGAHALPVGGRCTSCGAALR